MYSGPKTLHPTIAAYQHNIINNIFFLKQVYANNVFVVSLLHFLHERIEYSLALAHHLPQVPAPINQAGAPWPQRGRAVLDGTPSSIICSFPWRSDTTPPHPLLFMGRILMYHLGTKPHVKTYKMFYFTEPVAPGAAARPVWGFAFEAYYV